MSIKLIFNGPNIVQQMRELQLPVARAASAAMKEAAEIAKNEGRQNIASAGFGPKWQSALRANTYPPGDKPSMRAAALIFHKIRYAHIFETGGPISGKPLMWLPIAANLPFGVRSPRKFRGKLVSVNRPGKRPLLFDAQRRVPLFVGVPRVKIPKKFGVVAVVQRVAQRLIGLFVKNFNQD